MRRTRARKSAFSDGRQGRVAGRHAVQRTRPRNRLSANRRRSARAAIETFRYIQADTDEIRAGNGHGGARSMHMGGAALFHAAQEVIAKGTDRRAAAAGAAEEVEFARASSSWTVRHEIDLLSVARAARDPANLPEGMTRTGYLRLEPARYHHVPERMPHRRGGGRS